MVACRLSEPLRPNGWKGESCDLSLLEDAPPQDLVHDCPPWSETIVERSLLRCPEALARAVGVPLDPGSLVLHQVDEIDLYLLTDSSLHLFEVKRPSAHAQWRSAAEQIATYWIEKSAWLLKGDRNVFLWGVVPVRWSRRRQTLKVPEQWESTLAAISATLGGARAPVELGLLLYAILRSQEERWLFLWNAREQPPAVQQSAKAKTA